MRVRKQDTKQKRWRINTSLWGDVDEALTTAVQGLSPQQTYQCSDAEAYSVFAAVSPSSVLPLLAIGVRSAEDAHQFLDESGLGHLKEDNTQFVTEAVNRRIPAREIIEFVLANSSHRRDNGFIEACELNSDKEYQILVHRRGIASMKRSLMDLILSGEIRISDVRVISTETLSRHSSHSELIIDHLLLLNQHKLAYPSAEEMKQIITGAEKTNIDLKQSILIGGTYGMEMLQEYSTRIGMFFLAESLASGFTATEHTVDERITVLSYQEEIYQKYFLEDMNPHDVIQLHDNAISVDEAAQVLRGELTAEQYLAVKAKEVVPSVAKGWL